MANSIDTKVSVSGAPEYRNQMQRLSASAKELDSEMKALTAGFDENTSAAERSQKKNELLQRQIENQQAIVDALSGRYEEMTGRLDELAAAAQQAADEHGENSAEAIKARAEYDKFAVATAKVKTELNNAQAKLSTMQNGLTDTGDAAEEAAPKVSVFGEVLKANLAGDAIKTALSGLLGLMQEIGEAVKDVAMGSAAYADDIKTLSSTTGMSTKALQEYKYMAELTDVSLDTITGSQTKLIKSMSSAASGGKSAAAAFEKLGVDVKDSAGNLRGVDEVFNDVLTALGGVSNETERDALAMEVFGKSARELNPIIEAGADALEAFRQEANDVGYVLSDDQLDALGKVDDGYQRLQKRLDAFKHQLGVEIAPAAEAVFNALGGLMEKVDWDKFGEKVGEISAQFAGWLDNLSSDDISAGFNTAIDLATSLVGSLETIAELAGKISSLFGPDSWGGSKELNKDARAESWEAANQAIEANQALMQDQSVPYLERMNEAGPQVGLLSQQLDAMAQIMQDTAGPAAEDMADTFVDASDDIAGLASDAPGWGRDMVAGFSRGVDQEAPKLISKVEQLAEKIRGMMHFSRPDYGPLRDYETWMPDFMEGLARGIAQNQWRVEAATAAAADAMAAGISLNRQSANLGQQIGSGNAELLDAVRGIGGDTQVSVVLEGDAAAIFRTVRTENNRIANASGYNKLGRSR